MFSRNLFASWSFICILVAVSSIMPASGETIKVSDLKALAAAVNDGSPGDIVEITAGTYALMSPLMPKQDMTIRGAGIGKTILIGAGTWRPGTADLPSKENPNAYLFRFDKTTGVTISNMTLKGPNLHGAIWCDDSDHLELHDLHIESFLWSSIRTYRMDDLRVHDCHFVNAGGKQKYNGGALYMFWTKDSEFWNNRIAKTADHTAGNFFGIKGRGSKRCRIHHNTIEVGFSIEFPFENASEMEIDHNVLGATVSIPKYRGGAVIEEGYSFHIHHNWVHKSYAIEFSRNGIEIDHNLFDFSTEDDGGNLITDHGRVLSPGPALVHDNLIRNPGRGVLWTKGGYNNFYFYNNHVKAGTLTRSEGLFGFNPRTDFHTIVIRDNIIECTEINPRPLMRHEASYAAAIVNNQLVNVRDVKAFENPMTDAVRGLKEPLLFRCGVDGEIQIDGWDADPTEPDDQPVNGSER